MSLHELLQTRRSIRAYTDQPIDQSIIKNIFTTAQLSPSNCNTQPWHVSVISGAMRDKIEQVMLAEIMQGNKPKNHFPAGDQDLVDQYRRRQIECAKALYDSVGIQYEDKEKRRELMLRNWSFFGAPHVAFFSMPKQMGPVNAVDLGIYLQTVMLLMTERGIGCCAQGALAFYPDAAHQYGGVPETHAILCGLAFGYADPDAPINSYSVGRAPIEDSVTFIS